MAGKILSWLASVCFKFIFKPHLKNTDIGKFSGKVVDVFWGFFVFFCLFVCLFFGISLPGL